jgi:phytoene dehydrogenase-like protein
MSEQRNLEPDMLLVTDDPELEALLRERMDELSSQELAEYAHSLGLHPPGFGENMNPPIALHWPAEWDDEEEGILVWDARGDIE